MEDIKSECCRAKVQECLSLFGGRDRWCEECGGFCRMTFNGYSGDWLGMGFSPRWLDKVSRWDRESFNDLLDGLDDVEQVSNEWLEVMVYYKIKQWSKPDEGFKGGEAFKELKRAAKVVELMKLGKL